MEVTLPVMVGWERDGRKPHRRKERKSEGGLNRAEVFSSATCWRCQGGNYILPCMPNPMPITRDLTRCLFQITSSSFPLLVFVLVLLFHSVSSRPDTVA